MNLVSETGTSFEPVSSTTPGAGPVLLGCRNVTKTFNQVRAVEDVSIDLHSSEIAAVLGRSGSGKSTLLLCLAGIISIDSGTISYAGRALQEMKDAELAALRRSQFGFVFQFGHLLGELTASENVSLPLLLNGCARKEAQEAALTQLEALGVAELASRRPSEVSGGQSQRIAVARALVTKPRVVFADEPTGSLDTRNGRLVMELFVDRARAQGSAVLLVTHDDAVASYADRHVYMSDGRVVEGLDA